MRRNDVLCMLFLSFVVLIPSTAILSHPTHTHHFSISLTQRSYPTNYYLLTVFTLSMSYMVGTVTAMYEEMGAGDLVVEALFITATVFIVLTIFTLQSKWDFSFMGAGLGMCLWIMLLWVRCLRCIVASSAGPQYRCLDSAAVLNFPTKNCEL